MTRPVPTTPLPLLAAYRHCQEWELHNHYGNLVVYDENGYPAIPSVLAKRDNEAWRAKQAADFEAKAEARRKAAEAIAAQGNPTRERVRAIKEQQAALGTAIDGGALATLHATAGDQDRKLTAAARTRAELLGQIEPEYHSLRSEG